MHQISDLFDKIILNQCIFLTACFFAWSGGGPSLAPMSVFISGLF